MPQDVVQLNIRLSPETMEILEAQVFVYGGSLQALARPVLERFADELQEDPDVAQAVEARRRARARAKPDNVTALPLPKRRTQS